MAALALELPAATTTVTPELTVEATAELTAEEKPPPSDMLKTDCAETPAAAASWATVFVSAVSCENEGRPTPLNAGNDP